MYYIICSNVELPTNLFLLKDHFYKPLPEFTSKKLDMILDSLLNQRAMKMDIAYVDGV